jgi:hypothetical protein
MLKEFALFKNLLVFLYIFKIINFAEKNYFSIIKIRKKNNLNKKY